MPNIRELSDIFTGLRHRHRLNQPEELSPTSSVSAEVARTWIGLLEQQLLKGPQSRNKLIVGKALYMLATYLLPEQEVQYYSRWVDSIFWLDPVQGPKFGKEQEFGQDVTDLCNHDFTVNKMFRPWYVPGSVGVTRLSFVVENDKLKIINLMDYFYRSDPYLAQIRLHEAGILCNQWCDSKPHTHSVI